MNNNIKINIYNETPDDQTMVVFNQDTNIDGMFTKIFPTAWQQIPLGGLTSDDASSGNASYNTFYYPLEMQVGVSEHNTPYSPNERITTRACLLNSKWNFTIDDDYQRLSLRDDVNVDGTISCYNKSSKKVDISICKNSKPVIVYRGQDNSGVCAGDAANLQITPKLYIMYASEMISTPIFNSYISSNEVVELDLTNAREINVRLTVKDSISGLKEWKVTRAEY